VFPLFILLLFPLIYFVFSEKETNNTYFFYLTSVIFLFGMLLYPFDWKFDSVEDFIIIPFFVYLLFLITEIFIVRSFHEKIAVINLLLGIFGFVRHYLDKKGFKKW